MERASLHVHIHRDQSNPEWLTWRISRTRWRTGTAGVSGWIAAGSAHYPNPELPIPTLADVLPMIAAELRDSEDPTGSPAG
jgi:hypothetical protein